MKNDTLMMAGRTLNNDPSSFGSVVKEPSEEVAEALIKKDPAVREGIMKAS
ncbi:hypothetical protein [Guptibacillus spartinae]|uniref:hypothetical protein n=1 Tax=Guptibacillus spartinae TaxID=3025679 RepID=UPI002362EFA0|nr:hypothetical protein [Pseudalkalibacillus spartinae]